MMDWSGVDIYVIFISCLALILTAPIHCRASIGEQVIQICSDEEINSSTSWMTWGASKWFFRGNYFIFKIGTWTCFHKIHHNTILSLSSVTITRILHVRSDSSVCCFSKCTHMPTPVRTNHSTHITHTDAALLFRLFSTRWGFTLTQASYGQLFKLALKEHLSHGEAKHYFLFDQNAFQKKLSHGSFEQLTLSHLINMCSNDKPRPFLSPQNSLPRVITDYTQSL